MSGGIDSSAVCLMLLDEGYEVVGVTMRVWDRRASLPIRDKNIPISYKMPGLWPPVWASPIM